MRWSDAPSYRKWVGYGLLAAASLELVGTGWFAFTDRAWVMMGEQPEVHTEVLYFFIGMPLALIALLGAGAIIGLQPSSRERIWPVRVLVCLVGMALLEGGALIALPFANPAETAGLRWAMALIIYSVPALAVGLAATVLLANRSRKSGVVRRL